MPKGLYDPVRRLTDPLQTIHLKLPISVIRTINRAAAKRQRHATFVMREWMEAEATKWLNSQRSDSADADEEDVAPRKRRR